MESIHPVYSIFRWLYLAFLNGLLFLPVLLSDHKLDFFFFSKLWIFLLTAFSFSSVVLNQILYKHLLEHVPVVNFNFLSANWKRKSRMPNNLHSMMPTAQHLFNFLLVVLFQKHIESSPELCLEWNYWSQQDMSDHYIIIKSKTNVYFS